MTCPSKICTMWGLLIWVSVLYPAVMSVEDESNTTKLYYFPELNPVTYSRLGDINIGANILVTTASPTYPSGACTTGVGRPSFALEVSEAIAFATEMINNNPNILPNVSFGFVIRGSCTSIGPTLANSLAFLPRNQPTDYSLEAIQGTNSTGPYSSEHHDVIGTLTPGWSSLAIPVSSLYAVAHLPMVGAVETSDELSDKGKHPYFFRIVPPDVYQVQAMLNFIHSNRWSYVSVLYEDGAYGQNGFDNLQRMSEKYGVCIATSHRLLYSTDYNTVVSDLLDHSNARTVVLFMFGNTFRKILEVVVNKNATGHFIWIGSGGIVGYSGYEYEGTTTDPGIGTFIFEIYSDYISDFYDYLRKQDVINTDNPWMKPALESIFNCSFEHATCAAVEELLQNEKYKANKATALHIDAVLTFAQAAHDLLSSVCPSARGRDARDCINGELLREYLKNTTFQGYLGQVKFDENQESKGRYIISQFKYGYQSLSETSTNGTRRLLPKRVGIYNILSDTINYTSNKISWSHLNTLDRIFPWTEGSISIEIPESVCSGPCKVGQYKIEKELPCCWECRSCRENERLINGNTSCEVCPPFMWPDPAEAFTKCIDIPLTYSTLKDAIPVTLIALLAFALVVYLITFTGYVFYRNERVIKASSRELSIMQLVAILGGYANVLLFQMEPSELVCSVIYFLFCLSFVQLYSPLLVKTIRIFRIFQSGKSNKQNLRFVSPESQVLIAGFLILVQVAVCVAVYILFSPSARRTQPIWSEKLVELSCDLTLPGLASFLGYNVVLVSLCSVFAFKVRKLPDNFNESHFISMCVSTTLLIWLAFIPTYFTADREYVRVFLLSTALLLNHSVALIFLFIPKIYAAAFLSPESVNQSTGKSMAGLKA